VANNVTFRQKKEADFLCELHKSLEKNEITAGECQDELRIVALVLKSRIDVFIGCVRTQLFNKN